MTFPNSFFIETKKLKLRAPSLEDIPYIFTASQYEGFTDGMLWEPPKQEDELKINLKKSILAWEQGEGFNFTIVNKATDDFLGRISIRKTEEDNLWNVGFWTHPKHQGKGIMKEALKAIIDWGFEQLKADEIEACHALWNKASERVLKSGGMIFLRYLEKGFLKRGEWVEENLLSIRREIWEKRF
jgi:ribosomal-protein-alanine N-acetyltransferase